ncbi:DMT family transporter [Streptomyces sp. WMMB303]|uniref:DMT family transporter n=1 Tax=Streptomyces sp. WMMB303 TaxID=3034154 RepID=UPI0023ECA043|nr:DMT family transporter [Streptomyces sp. WMMB303]MDF4251154.1 DMT family transporter [Streptomyces sp. WMMB303]
MTPIVVAAVLAAALTHATWNALAHGIRDQLLAFTLVGSGGAVCGAALACFVPLPAAGAWPPLLVSAALHVVYQALLMRSFRMGEFGQMYPIARGTAPLVVTVLAAVFVHEMPDGWQLAGVLLASAGLVGVALWGLRGAGRSPETDAGEAASGSGEAASGPGAGPQWPALTAAVCTGLAIASYTVVDGVGVRAAGSPLGYIAWLMLLEGLAIPAWALLTRRRALVAELRPVALRGLLGGALSVLAYGLVLWAQTRAPLAPVAALRESSIIAGATIGALFFKERFGWPRTAASVLMVGGIALMLHGT